METAVERRPGSKVAMTITVEPAIIEERMEKQFQKRARKVTVPGFRPGKAPRRLIEERLAPLASAMQQEAIEDTIDETYKVALNEKNLQPLERGDIEDLKLNDDHSLTYTVLVSVRPEITLPDYTGIAVTKTVTQVTDEQVNAELERLRESTADFSEVTDEGIQDGDYVTVDYTMAVDGQPYPEGDTTGYPLEVGSDTFFPELNEALPGVKQGDTTTVTHTYPEDYSDKALAGKTATFDITVQQVRRVMKPEVTDDWANMISQGALPTVEALLERIKSNLQAMTSQADRDQVRGEIVRKIVEGAELELPDTLVEDEQKHLMHEFEHRLGHEHMSLDDYAESTGRTVDDIRNEQQLMARDMVRRSLVLQEVARREGISVSNEEIDAILASTAQSGQSVKELRASWEKSGRLDSLASRIFHEKVLGFLEDQANITVEGEVQEPEPVNSDSAAPEETTEKPE